MNLSKYYKCKSSLISGKSYSQVYKISRKIYNSIKSKTKRGTYLKSAYFKGEKIFLDNFWPHLNQKNPRDRKNRLRYFEGAIELVQNSKHAPIEFNTSADNESLYRFMGQINDRYFVVQIKEDLKRNQKFFMSMFEYKNKNNLRSVEH